jgi:hypothetical protein
MDPEIDRSHHINNSTSTCQQRQPSPRTNLNILRDHREALLSPPNIKTKHQTKPHQTITNNPNMPTFKALLTTSLALLSLLPSINALGCYADSGLAFNELHGGKTQEIMGEVFADINTQCQKMAGVKLHPKAYTQFCTEWAITVAPDTTCYEDCSDGCSAVGAGGRGGELAAALCGSGCDPECGGPRVGGTNHIYWKFQNLSGEEEVTMTYDVCMEALNSEASACSRGSEQNHEGFFYVIDPNEGSCPPLTGKLYGSR